MIKEELEQRKNEINEILNQYLPESRPGGKALAEAMRYSLCVGGKRLRPIMMQESYRMFGGEDATIDPFLAAIEMIHTHSLVHDDLPALDNDEYRRGNKTTHAVYGEAIAVLAGAGLLNLAFETVLQTYYHQDVRGRILRSLQILAAKTGLYGMLGGQGLDVENEKKGKPVEDKDTLLYIYEKKTSALIEASLMIGAVLAGAEKEDVDRMEKIGKLVGLLHAGTLTERRRVVGEMV
ncbi:MAG: polyprenyl synthetase family protein, partial [Eubacterium sp.]|nr:polyprenyl synthetase family protein [Eubacterium sp.]